MPKQEYSYQVLRKLRSNSAPIGRATSYPKAFKKFLQSPRAYGIQRYVKGSTVTAGLIQPTIPHKITVKGAIYERGYVGHHTKKTAASLASGFRKDGHKAVVRKFKGGWQVFVKFDKRRL